MKRFSFNVLMFSTVLLYATEVHSSPELAAQLSAEGDHYGAALELRRIALNPDASPALIWAAAWETWRDGHHETARKLLDAAEDRGGDYAEIALLRAETDRDQRRWASAAFHYESAAAKPHPEARAFVARRRAALDLRGGRGALAALHLQEADVEDAAAQQAIQDYLEGRDKNPRIGAWLGLVPGLGYLYAGEPSNAFRSLLLNSLFIWGMIETAEQDYWGAFAVITFFEITWYSGSIYGGFDATHRYNHRRLDRALDPIEGRLSLKPDYELLPEVGLRFAF